MVPTPGDPARATLYVNGVPSSPVNADPSDLEFEYLQAMAAVLDLGVDPGPPDPLRVLHLGGGGCALARHLEAVRPGSRQVVAEVDADLAALVRQLLPLPRSPLLRVRVGDAAAVLAARPAASADVVVRDAFAGDTTPRHLTTAAFLTDVARVLTPTGTYLANVVDRTGAPAGAPLRAEVATAVAVFGGVGHVALVAEPAVLRGRRYGNVVLVASASPVRARLAGGGLARRLRGGAVPAHLVVGDEVAAAASAGWVITAPS